MSAGFGPRTYLVGQALAGLLANPANSLTWNEIVDTAIMLADRAEYQMGRQVIHSWEKKDGATVSESATNQDEAEMPVLPPWA